MVEEITLFTRSFSPLQPKCHEQGFRRVRGQPVSRPPVTLFAEAILWLKRAEKVRGGEGGGERDDGEELRLMRKKPECSELQSGMNTRVITYINFPGLRRPAA